MSFLSSVFGCGAKTGDPSILDLPPVPLKPNNNNKVESRPPLPPASLPPTSPPKPRSKERSRQLPASKAPSAKTQSANHGAYPHSRKASISQIPRQQCPSGPDSRDQSPYRGEPALGQRYSSGTGGITSEYNSSGLDTQHNSTGMPHNGSFNYFPQQGPEVVYPMSQMGHPFGYPMAYPFVGRGYGYGHPGMIQQAPTVVVPAADWVIYPSQFPSAQHRGGRIETHSQFSDSPASYNANNLVGERQSPSAGNYPVSSDSGQEENSGNLEPITGNLEPTIGNLEPITGNPGPNTTINRKVEMCEVDCQTDPSLLVDANETALVLERLRMNVKEGMQKSRETQVRLESLTYGLLADKTADAPLKDDSGTDVRSDECQISETLPQSSPKSEFFTDDGQSTHSTTQKAMISSSPPRPQKIADGASHKSKLPRRPVTTSVVIERDADTYQTGESKTSASHERSGYVRQQFVVVHSDVPAAYCEKTLTGEPPGNGIQINEIQMHHQDPGCKFRANYIPNLVQTTLIMPAQRQATQPTDSPSRQGCTGEVDENWPRQQQKPQANVQLTSTQQVDGGQRPRTSFPAGQMHASPDIEQRRLSFEEGQQHRLNTNPVGRMDPALESGRHERFYDGQQLCYARPFPEFPPEANVSMMEVSTMSQESLSYDRCGVEPDKRSATRQTSDRAIDCEGSAVYDNRRESRKTPKPTQGALDAAAEFHSSFGTYTPTTKVTKRVAGRTPTSNSVIAMRQKLWQEKCDKYDGVPGVPEARFWSKKTGNPKGLVQTTSSTSVPSNSDEDIVADSGNAEKVSTKLIDRVVINQANTQPVERTVSSRKSQTRRSSIMSPTCSVGTAISEWVAATGRKVKVFDELDAELQTTMEVNFTDCPLEFIRMKKDHYAVIASDTAPSSDKLFFVPRFETQFSLDRENEPESIANQLKNIHRLSSTHPPKNIYSVDDLPQRVLCFVRARVSCHQPEVSIMTRVDVLRHFGSTAVRKWLFLGNPTFSDQQGLQKPKRALSVTLGRTHERRVPSGGQQVWRDGEFLRLCVFVNHFQRFSAVKSQCSQRGQRGRQLQLANV